MTIVQPLDVNNISNQFRMSLVQPIKLCKN